MTTSSPKSFLSYQEILEHTRLGRLCGKKQLFQERYHIRQLLGRGGFGVTFLGCNVVLPGSPLCVIKQLCLPLGSLPDAFHRAKTRFRKEAKILSLLGHHSQIPLLLDYFVIDEEFYLVQEFIKGYTLSKIVKRYGVQPEEFVKRTLKSMLPVLSYIHARGVIHRDIKPQNIILAADDGRLVLIDFGSVKEELHLNDHNLDQSLTQHFIGTLGFCAPEQLLLKSVYASDIYSLGMTCLFLLTGHRPSELQDNNDKNIINWREKTEISPQFADILDKMIHADLTKRYSSASEVLEDLEVNQRNNQTIITQLTQNNFNNQWIYLQSQNIPAKQPQYAIHHNINSPEYNADLLNAYYAYNKLSQVAQGKNQTHNQDLNNNLINKTSKQKTKNQEIQEEITEIQKAEKIPILKKLSIIINNLFKKLS